MVPSLDPLDGAIDAAAPLLLLVLDAAPLALVAPLDVSFAELIEGLLGVLLGARPLEVSAGVLDPLFTAGRFISTSPLDVPVTVLLGDALLTGTQLLVFEAAAESLRVDGVVPVPLAPFVVFSPVKR